MDVIIEKMDFSGSGSISFTEFCIVVQRVHPNTLKARLTKMFEIIAKNKSKSLSLLQIVEFVHGLGMDAALMEE